MYGCDSNGTRSRLRRTCANLRKHKVSFEAARSVFFDDLAVQFFDSAHAINEDRFLLPGMSADHRLLLVCHCEREEGEVIRIISARKATTREARFYPGA